MIDSVKEINYKLTPEHYLFLMKKIGSILNEDHTTISISLIDKYYNL